MFSAGYLSTSISTAALNAPAPCCPVPSHQENPGGSVTSTPGAGGWVANPGGTLPHRRGYNLQHQQQCPHYNHHHQQQQQHQGGGPGVAPAGGPEDVDPPS